MFSDSRHRAGLFVFCVGIFGLMDHPHAQTPAVQEPREPIATVGEKPDDEAIKSRVQAIFEEIPAFDNVEVKVQSGVVTLQGTVTDAEIAQRAQGLVSRVQGVAAIENRIDRDVSLETRLEPALDQTRSLLTDSVSLLPLIGVALAVFAGVLTMGILIAGRNSFWMRIAPNQFIADLATTTVRVVFFVIALMLALNLLGATALLGAVLGSAGVIGLAVGFAVRDTIENYIASVLLSLRQPFRPKDHVVINGQEGRVIRLTSRATLLMTIDGNQLRIPNAEVFKGTILNYSANPERRLEFELGVDADDDPLAAIHTGVEALQKLEFVLPEPPPFGVIRAVGDSNIPIQYFAWINQRNADFGKSRSIALAHVKRALEEAGFGLPEPIYRLRFDKAVPGTLSIMSEEVAGAPAAPATREHARQPAPDQALDVSPQREFDQKVEQERLASGEADLLDASAPTE